MQAADAPWHALCGAQVTLQAFWLPFAMLALSLVMGGNWVSDALGILAGHL